jgi:hypothetical protein
MLGLLSNRIKYVNSLLPAGIPYSEMLNAVKDQLGVALLSTVACQTTRYWFGAENASWTHLLLTIVMAALSSTQLALTSRSNLEVSIALFMAFLNAGAKFELMMIAHFIVCLLFILAAFVTKCVSKTRVVYSELHRTEALFYEVEMFARVCRSDSLNLGMIAVKLE